MTPPDDGLYAALVARGITRRAFLRFSAAMAAALALPAAYAPRIARALETAPRLPVVWLRGQSCGGNGEAFLRAAKPTIAELLLDLLSVEYDERLLAPAGADATRALTDAVAAHPNGFVLVVEGAVPTGDASPYCLVGGRPFREVVREVSAKALATIAVGACAFDGGIAAADGGETGAGGLSSVIGGDIPLICLPGCPVNTVNLAATITHYLTQKAWPPTDSRRRPYSFYGNLIHNQCERRAHFEFGEFVLAWGDEGAQKDWCLYKVGCKGPETFANCPTVEYAEGASWPIRAGHGCIGCHMPDFWDSMTPAYRRLPEPFFLFPNISIDTVGQAMIGAMAGVTAVHGTASWVRNRYRGRVARRAARGAATAVAGQAAPAEREDEPQARTTPETEAPAAEQPTATPEPVVGLLPVVEAAPLAEPAVAPAEPAALVPPVEAPTPAPEPGSSTAEPTVAVAEASADAPASTPETAPASVPAPATSADADSGPAAPPPAAPERERAVAPEAEPAEPAAAQPAEPDEPAEPAEPAAAQPAEPAEPARPAQTTQPEAPEPRP